MQPKRTVLYLNDPLKEGPHTTKGLVFTENESFLSRAQTALWHARSSGSWICVAGEGYAAYIALALAAQLPVDRIALVNMPGNRIRLPREIARIRTFARRNLALIAAEILLIGADDAAVQAVMRGTGRCRVCALDSLPESRFTDSWESICLAN